MDKNNQSTVAPNWENTSESWLAEIKIWEVCPDWTGIGELGREMIGAD
jgi:hypothetical protein